MVLKRYILVSLILPALVLAGCDMSPAKKVNEKSAPDNLSSFNEAGVMNRINEIKNGATRKVAPDQESKPLGQTQRQSRTTPPPRQSAPPPDQKEEKVELKNLAKTYSQALIKTNFGNIKVKFYAQEAPLTVNNFMNLAQDGFYTNTKFHRVIPDFMIQGGDPNSKDDNWSDDGQGGPGYRFQDEINSRKLVRGSLAMANSGPNTNGSQFFIVTKEAVPWLDGKHTNFGEVVEGMDVVEEIEQVDTNAKDHPTEDVVVEGIELLK